MKTTKKLISILLVLVMVLNFAPVSVMAEDDTIDAPEEIEETYAPESETESESETETAFDSVSDADPEPETEPGPALEVDIEPEAAPEPAESSTEEPSVKTQSTTEENGTKDAEHSFVTQPTGGTVQPNSNLTLSWSTNFTPAKVEIGYGSNYYSETIVATLTSNLKQSMSYPLEYGNSTTSEYWFIRAYPESGSSAKSDFFTVTRGALSFTTVPAGGSVQPESSITLSWSTNFTPSKVVIGYGSVWNETPVATITSGLSRSMSYSLSWDKAAFTTDGYYIRAYYDDDHSARSEDFTVTKVNRKFTKSPQDATISAGGTSTVTWTTNFTITRVEIYARNSDYQFILYKSLSGATNSYTFTYAETPPTAYLIRAYYGSGQYDYAESDSFHMTPKPFGFTTQPESEVEILPQSSTTIHWALNFTPVKIELWTNKAGSNAYKKRVASLNASATSYSLSYDEEQEYWLQVYYGSGSNEFYYSNVIHASPTDYTAEEVGDCHLYLEPDMSETVQFTANFSPSRIEVWTSDLNYTNKTLVETISGTVRSYSIGYDFEELVWFQLYYTDLSGEEQYKNVLYFVHHTVERAFTTQPPETASVPYQGTRTLSWQTNFQPTRIEIIRSYLNSQTWTMEEELIATLPSTQTSYPFQAGSYYHVRAYYMTKTGEGHVDSIGIELVEDNPAFSASPSGGTVNPEGTLRLTWTTNFIPQAVSIGYKTSSGLFVTTAQITAGFGKNMSHNLAYDNAYNGKMYVRAWYGDGTRYVDSSSFTVTMTPRTFSIQPSGGTINPDSSLTLNWATNFTPTAVHVGWYNSSGEWITKAEITTGLNKSMSYPLPYDTAIHGNMLLRAYYSGDSFVESDSFTVTKVAHQYTTQPTGGKIYPWTTLKLSWTTNFVPTRVQIGYLKEDGRTFVPVGTLATGLKKSMNYTLNYEDASASTNWRIYAYYYQGSQLVYVPSNTFTVETLTAYVCGDDLTAVLDNYGTLTFSGTGAMYNYYYGATGTLIRVPWNEERTSIKKVVIPDGVTYIGDYAFYYCNKLTTITIPPSVTQIGESAFNSCNALSTVIYDGFPAQWDAIDIDAGNSKLTNASVTYLVRTGTLNGTDIRWGIYGEQNLLEIDGWGEIPGHMQMPWYEYGEYIEKVIIWNGITKIGEENFRGCTGTKTIYLPNTLTWVDDMAFSDCEQLSDVYFDGTLDEWEEITIRPYNDPLTDANIHTVAHQEQLTDDVSWSVDDAGLLRIWVDDDLMGSGDQCYIPHYSTTNRPPWFEEFADKITAIRVEDGVTVIGQWAFATLPNLRTVEFADSVTGIASYAFSGCSSLTDIELSDNITSITASVFRNCTSLTQIRLPASASISQSAFYGCSKLEKVWLPENATSIPDEYFRGCSKLKELHIPGTVTSIGKNAFYGCTALKNSGDVYFDGTSAQWAAIAVNTTGNGNLQNAANIHFNPEELRVDAVNFPDERFRAYVAEFFDADNSGWLTDAERADAGDIDDEDNDYTSLQGIEYFPKLTGILIDAAPSLTSVDLTANTELNAVDLSGNGNLAQIYLTGLTDLTYLFLSGNALTELDLTGLSDLQYLSVSSNPLQELDVSELSLKELYCSDTGVSGLDLSGQTALYRLYCYNSNIKELDISGCPLLCEIIRDGTRTVKTLNGVAYVEYKLGNTNKVLAVDEDCIVYTENTGIRIDTVNFPDPVFRQYVYEYFDTDRSGCLSNEEIEAATAISLDSFDDLTSVKGIAYFTELTSLELTNNPNLTAIDLTANTKITYMDLSCCGLSKLDVSMLTALTKLWCNNNPLTSLTLGTQMDLKLLHCYGTGGEAKAEPAVLPELDISGCSILLDAVQNGEMSEPDWGVMYSGPLGGVLYVDAGTRVKTSAFDVIFNHTCSVQNNLKIYFKAKINSEESYDSVWLHLERQKYSGASAYAWEEFDITDYTIDSSGRYVFGYAGIAAAEMGDEIRATLHATKDGEEYVSEEDVYSIRTYAYNSLEKYASNTKLCTLLVDMLNYGAAAQTYFGLNTGNLVNADLTAAQQALATPQASAYTSCEGETALEGAIARVATRTLSLGNSVVLRAYVTFDNAPTEGTYVQFRYTSINGTTQIVKVNYGEAGNFTYDSAKDRYQVNLSSMAAADFGQPVEITVYDGSGQISGVYTYSVETYVHNMMEREGYEALKTLLHAMMSYSNGAKAYFNQ